MCMPMLNIIIANSRYIAVHKPYVAKHRASLVFWGVNNPSVSRPKQEGTLVPAFREQEKDICVCCNEYWVKIRRGQEHDFSVSPEED